MNTRIETAKDRFANKCVASCKKLVAQIKQTRNSLLTEYRESVKTHQQLLQLALNEAEAIAWQTPYPQLFFPSLAQEKVQAVASWEAHQQLIRKTSPVLKF